MRKLLAIAALGLVVLALIFGSAAIVTRAADHLDAPLVDTDGRIDITDIYAFQTHTKEQTVLIMDVNPLAGVLSTSPTTFRADARYEFRIDNSGDFVQDITYRITFSKPDSHGRQGVTLQEIGTGQDEGDVIAKGMTGEIISVNGGGRLFAGLKDDPFFFDLNAFKKFQADGKPADFCSGPQGTGSDFFKGFNVTAIVLQVPTKHLLGKSAPLIYPWGVTLIKDHGGRWLQADRMGKPALATVFIKPVQNQKFSDAYNATQPKDDKATWGSFFPSNPIPLLGGISVRDLLLPDVLILNTSGPLVLNNIPFDGYPNGRRLQDDVIDTSFLVLSNASVLPPSVTSDCVANDSIFSPTYPYLGAPNP